MAEEKGFSNYQLSAGTLASLRAANKTYLTDFSPLEDLAERVSTEGVALAQAKEDAAKEAKKQLEDEKQKTLELMESLGVDAIVEGGFERAPQKNVAQEGLDKRLEESLQSEEREMELAKKIADKEQKKLDTERIKAGGGPSVFKSKHDVPNNINYDERLKESSESIASRGGVATETMRNHFQNLLRDVKESKFFSQATDPTQKKKDRMEAFGTLSQLGTAVKAEIAPGGIIETVNDIYKDNGFSNATTDIEKEVWSKLFKMDENVTPGYTENNDLVYRVQLDNGGEYAADRTWMNKFAKDKSYPHQRELDFQKQLLNLQEIGRQNGIYNKESMIAQSKKMITPDNINSIMLDPTFASTSSLLELMMESGIIDNLPKPKMNELIDRAKVDDKLFDELATLGARGIERVMYNQGYALGKSQFDKENPDQAEKQVQKTRARRAPQNMSIAEKIQYYKNL